ncbi:MAG: hypothetical protein KGL39_09520 [Patescibacteria group bacterium]|nr:hypothetical protein [Patescibacteria group bacterium]
MWTNGDKIMRGLPATLNVYMASDYATMEPQKGKKEPDYTEHGVWGVDRNGDLFAVDWWFAQCETDKSIDAFLHKVQLYKPIRAWNEGGLIDKAIRPAIRSRMRQLQTFVMLEPLPSLQDKAVKLQAFHARATMGTVWFPLRAPWAERVIDQLVRFPGGRWDDAADVCGLVGRGLDKMFNPVVQVRHESKGLVPFTAEWLEYEGDKKPKVRYFA